MASVPQTSMSSPSTPATVNINQKRARPTKSCLECRRKKLKCDRVQPCMQCKKLGRADLCVYAYGSSGTLDADNDHGREVKRPRVEVSKLSQWGNGAGMNDEMQRDVHGNPEPNPIWPYLSTMRQETRIENEVETPVPLGRFHIKGARSKYTGLCDRLALLDHFSDEKNFLKGSYKDPDLAVSMQDLADYHQAIIIKQRPIGPYFRDQITMFTKMLDILPENLVIDTLVVRYVLNLESVLRVLHIPSLLDQVEEIKRERNSPSPALSPGFLPQLLGVLVISSRLSDSQEPGFQQLPESLISQYMALLKLFLERLKGKDRTSLLAIRVETLLLIANITRMGHGPHLWKESGNLIRLAMIMGLHRDPEDWVNISSFEKEQRRKIWQTVVELDLQMSLSSGLFPAIKSSDFTSISLINVDDCDLTEDMLDYPDSQPRGVWTDALPQIVLALSIKERLDAAHILAGNIIIERDATELLDRARNLEHAHDALQSIIPPRSKPQHTFFSNVMMNMFIRRFSLALYRTVAMSELSPQYPDARKGALRSSVAVLAYLDALDPAVADLDTIKTKNYLNLFHVLFKDDVNQAALLLCYEIRSFNSRDGERSNMHDGSAPWTKHSLTRIVENTLSNHLQRLGELGSDLKMILPLSIILQSVRSDGSPDGKREMMIRGTKRVLDACRKALPKLQEPANINPQLSNGQEPDVQMTPTHAPSNATPTGQRWNPNVLLMPQYPDLATEQFNSLFAGNHQMEMEDTDFGFSDWGFSQSWF